MATHEPRERRDGVLKTAGLGALTVLRKTRQRTKLSSLHLPIPLQPQRRQTIVLREGEPAPLPGGVEVGQAVAGSAPVPFRTVPPPGADHRRALRSRRAASERRVAQLRHALERERQARAHALAAMARPEALIDQLVADLTGATAGDAALRATVTRVLEGYGFAAGQERPEAPPTGKGMPRRADLPALPGWSHAELQAAAKRAQARQPEITGGDVALCLQAVLHRGEVTPELVAREARLTSGLARRRVRLALEALAGVGVLVRHGSSYGLAPVGSVGSED